MITVQVKSVLFACFYIHIDQIDAVGGDHDLLMPSLHEQIRGVDQIIM